MNYKELLQIELGDKDTTPLKEKVIYDLLAFDTDEEIANYIDDIQKGGCAAGSVNDLIYYVDTHNFAKTYLVDIMELFQEATEQCGEAPKITNDPTNWLAWFGYEQTIWQLSELLGLDN